MSLPEPVPGLVIHYRFLRSREARAGKGEGSKDRPCAIIVTTKVEKGTLRLIVAPITHTVPDDPNGAMEVPIEASKQLGLADTRKWLVYDELNSFAWPGFDLRPIPKKGTYHYGMLPKDLFERLRKKILERDAAKRRFTRRDE